MRLEDKVALITGAASGIGEATAKRFATEGAAVVVADIDEAGGARVVDEIRKVGGRAEFQRADIGEPADVEQMIAYACERLGRIDILHNNAVSMVIGHVGELELEGWRKTLDVSLTGYWYATKCALAPMVAQGGGIVLNTASISGLAGDFKLGVYNAVKAAVLNLTRTTALEYARKGIRCNAICPGPIHTPTFNRAIERKPEVYERVADAIPMGRCGEPEEVANVALFLASDESSYITGEYIVVDGGLQSHTGTPSLSGVRYDW